MKNTTSCEMKKQKTTVPVSKSACFDDLPEEIVAEILVRLPTRTLVIFKSICKLWLYLISNPMFVKSHLQKSHLLNTSFNNRLLFVSGDRSGINYPHSDFFIKSVPINIDDESNIVVLDYPTRDPFNTITIVGSCHGLVCIAIDKVGVFLWNPCTRISRKLPLSGLDIAGLVNFGFGYDRSNDDYKVVLMARVVGSKYRWELKKVVEVYSLKSDLWGKIGDFPHYKHITTNKAEHINGVLHWPVLQNESNGLRSSIISLDLGNETYGKIERPCYDKKYHVRFIKLSVLEGCLSVYCIVNDCVDIWVMKEYGNRNKWIKLHAIWFTHRPVYPLFYDPICISTTTGEILMSSLFSLVLYNPNHNSLRELKFGMLNQTTTYVESLVSPNIYEEVSNTEH